MQLSETQILVNRGLFTYHLRQNPQGRDYIHGDLHDGGNGRCSVGLGCELFGIPLVAIDKDSTEEDWRIVAQAYDLLAQKIGGHGLIGEIWAANDNGIAGDSFAGMADFLEETAYPGYAPKYEELEDEDE